MAGQSSRLIALLTRIAAFVAVMGGLGWFGYWVFSKGETEREREEARELSIKQPSRRIVDPKTQEVVIQLDRPTQQRLGLAVEPIRRTQWQKTLKLLGFTIVVPHRLAEVRSPWTGVLKGPSDKPMPTVGQKISKGQLLGNLLAQWSPSDRIQLESQLRDARAAITETQAQLRVARSTVERLGRVGEQVVASKVLIEAQGSLAQLEARLSAAQAREKDLQQALSQSAAEFRFRLTAPQDGQLTELSGRPGEVVSAGSVVATIYDPRELWVSAWALPSALSLAEIPDQAEITLPGFERKPLSARLVRINTHVAPQQQGIELVYGAINPGGLIPIGLQAEAVIRLGRPKEVVQAPQSALLQLSDRRLIYLQRAPEEFVKRFVEVEGEEGSAAYLRPTLPANAKIVVRGAQTLLSEEYKESIQLIEEGD